MESPLSEDWRAFLKLLNSHRVKYLLVGAHAVAIHAEPRMTADLDVFVEASETNARKIIKVLTAFGFGSLAPEVEDLAKPGALFMLGRAPHRIGILTKISGVTFGSAYAARVRVSTTAGKVGVISREHLIKNKRAAGRIKDALDLELPGAPKRRVTSRRLAHA